MNYPLTILNNFKKSLSISIKLDILKKTEVKIKKNCCFITENSSNSNSFFVHSNVKIVLSFVLDSVQHDI